MGCPPEYKFNVENLSDKETSYNLLFSNIENEFDSNLIYELYENDKLSVSKTVAPKSGGNSYIKLNITIKPTKTISNIITYFHTLSEKPELTAIGSP